MQAAVSDWLRLTTDDVAYPESVLFLCNLADCNKEFPLFAADGSVYAKQRLQISMAELVKGARQSDARLNRVNPSCPSSLTIHHSHQNHLRPRLPGHDPGNPPHRFALCPMRYSPSISTMIFP